MISILVDSLRLHIYDCGGHIKFRDLWEQYFINTKGVIYVIDFTDEMRLVENGEEISRLLSTESF